MKKITKTILCIVGLCLFIISCSKKDSTLTQISYPAIEAAFGSNLDLNNLVDYAGQSKPVYITKDNTRGNNITNAKATLGRVLFYDKNLSIDNSISCGSCHKQEFAFGDNVISSTGVAGGTTARHSMRLVNARFSNEEKFFWDERAATLEIQTTKPIQDHAEMGFSGLNGRPNITNLITKLQNIDYYNELFKFVYNDITISETKLQECLAQFVRSIQSFDSKYDAGRAQVGNDNQNFPNFTAIENQGKNLFLAPPNFDINSNRIAGGLGCGGCHRAPDFDIDPNSRNNGIIGIINSTGRDLTNTKSPSLRDMVKADGTNNGLFMHTGALNGIRGVLNHYNIINFNPAQNNNIDPKLSPNGMGQKLNITEPEIQAVIAFLQTLAGTNIYSDKKWSNPFK